MKRPLAYITAPWSNNEFENTENAAKYCRKVYDAGFNPICPILSLPLKIYTSLKFNDIINVMKNGANIMGEREKAGLSQEQLATKIHITQQQLALYECDLEEMSVTRLQEIAETLKIPVSNLLKKNKDLP